MAVSREKLIRNAEKFVSRGRIEAAIREYRKVLEDQPKDTGTLNRVGDLYARINKIDEAVRLFTQIAEQYTEEGFFVKAIAIYKKIIKLDPTRLSVYEKLAGLYHRQGLVNEARTQYQVLADYYVKHANAASAISIYLQMADLEPDDPAHRAKLAELYQQEQLNDKAVEQYQQIADIMLEHGRVDQAVQVLQRGLEISPDDLDFLAEAVDKLRNAGQSEGARQLVIAVKDSNPAAEGLLATMTAEVEEAAAGDSGDEYDLSAAPTTQLEPVSEEDLGGDQFDLPPVVGSDDLLDHDDELQRAMAAAEAAVGASGEATPSMEEDDMLLEWDEKSSESLIAPPPDMADKGPEVAGSGFSQESESLEDPADVTGSWEIDLSELDLGDVVDSPATEGASAEDAEASEAAAAAVGEEVDDLDLEPVDAGGFDFGREASEAEAVDGTSEPFAADSTSSEESPFSGDVSFETEPFEDTASGVSAPEDGLAVEADVSDEQELDFSEAFAELPELSIEGPAEEAEVPTTSFEDMLSEAEVLAKYGLREKAFERVDQVLAADEGHPGAHRVLIQLRLEDGDEAEVRRLAGELRKLSEERGEQSDWEKVQDLFAAAGFALEEKQKKKPARKKAPKKERPTGDRIDKLLASLLDDAPAPVKSRRKKKDATADLLSSLGVGPRATAKPTSPPSEGSPQKAGSGEAAPAAAKPAAEFVTEPIPIPGVESKEEPPALTPLEIEAAEKEIRLDSSTEPAGRSPRGPKAGRAPAVDLEDDSDIDDALAGMSPVFDIPALEPASVVDTPESVQEFGEDTGTSWLDEVEAERQAADGSDALFEEEEGFFDLAAELEEELTVSDALGDEQGGEQTLEEIVEGFKRGVEEHLSEEDYDTHFDLGIAYREMGLLDEAIGEFQVASKAPEHLVSCCSMLGICFLDKGLPELAVKWYTRGLASPSLSEEDSLALLYDLGAVYLSSGDEENARKTFVEVYGIRSNYRDVADKLKALEA